MVSILPHREALPSIKPWIVFIIEAMGIYPSYVARIVVVPGCQDVAQNVRLGDRLTTEREPDNP
ncbi:MAG: hypothetical protein VXY81_08250, partial [Pseudomonadota bacterium]|nr:hypothetical protein [Pseudomonadota bacterium]